EHAGELGEEAPLVEALEAVQHEHERMARRGSAREREPSSDRSQRVARVVEAEVELVGGAHPKRPSWPSGRTYARSSGYAARSSTGPRTGASPSSARSSSAFATAFP